MEAKVYQRSPTHRANIARALIGKKNGWKGDAIEYDAAHRRAAKILRGLPCLQCGAPKAEAALKGGAGAFFSNRYGCWYSTNPADYIPLCRACHLSYDSGHRMIRFEHFKH